jgi:cellulose synthase/poly-beta-1,6-N-acetylglucosamine synthase-like glycosyltransferase
MLDGLTAVFFAMPLIIIAMNFGLSLWFRLFKKDTLFEGDDTFEPSVSVLLPVYNEGSHVLETIESILSCDYPAEKLQIVAIDDRSKDDSFQWVLRAKEKYPDRIHAEQNEVNSGKHKTLSRALQIAKGEIVICIDSDCIFEPDVIRQLVKCFSDPKMGAVGGSVGITNVNENMATAAQAMVYWLSFQVGKMLQNSNRRVMCISGCLFAVRKNLFEEIEQRISGRNWFGISIRDGEDRYMTHEILMQGWKTYINPEAQCWTHAPTRVSDLFMQQVRWRRSGLRDLFWTIRRLPEHVRVFGLLSLSVILIPELFTVVWAFLLLSAIFFTPSVSAFFISLSFFGVGYIVIGMAYNLFMKSKGWKEKMILNPIVMPVIGIWHLVDAIFTTILALFTFDNGTWGTRENPKEQK